MVHQTLGLVKMKVSDCDDQVHGLDCCMHDDPTGKPIRKYYFFDPYKHRERYAKALDTVSHVEANKFAMMRDQKRGLKRRGKEDFSAIHELLQKDEPLKFNSVRLYINLECLTEICGGKVVIKTKNA